MCVAVATWNRFDGLAFQVKGDGSANFGCIRLQAGSYDKAWVGNFPLQNPAWHEVETAWKDFVPAGLGVGNSATPTASNGGHQPDRLWEELELHHEARTTETRLRDSTTSGSSAGSSRTGRG